MSQFDVIGHSLIGGLAQGAVLFSDVGLSFWGGVDPATGVVIDQHHPLRGCSIAGRILAIPSGRGSCTGSNVLLELMLNGHAPAALVFGREETILPLGVIVAEELFGPSIPVVALDDADFQALRGIRHLRVDGPRLTEVAGSLKPPVALCPTVVDLPVLAPCIDLSEADRLMLEGNEGRAVQAAMRILVRLSAIGGASRLIDVSQVHIDGCIYIGPASLAFAQRFADWGAGVKLPTSLNAISVDRVNWRRQGVDPDLAGQANALADCYTAMGAAPTYTCAPYLLDTAPKPGDQIAWSESNAVAYANSIIGARTMKYPDYLDLCVALTGRGPFISSHVEASRRATVQIEIESPAELDDAFWPCLGHLVGSLAPDAIPVVTGLEGSRPDEDACKNFAAAFATMSGAPMFHIAGVTPEAPDAYAALGGKDPARVIRLTRGALLEHWRSLNTAVPGDVDLVALGNPHFSLNEFRRLAALCRGKVKHPRVAVVVTCGRAVHQRAEAEGLVGELHAFGVTLVRDTCWCMITEPLLPPSARALVTNSGKYAHYAPGLVGRAVHLGGLSACVEAAVTGVVSGEVPGWLRGVPLRQA